MSFDNIRCPENMDVHLKHVMAGEYDVPGAEFSGPPVILDIGANVGAFALWAMKRWPGCTVHCYEPAREAYADLLSNLAALPTPALRARAIARKFAVGDPALTKLMHGTHNIGEASFYVNPCINEADFEEVEVIAPADLPAAHVVKLDCEGSEGVIVRGLRLAPQLLLAEYHNEHLRRELDAWALEHGHILVGSCVYEPGRGVVKYMCQGAFGAAPM
jgi:FkbM family methyltransferase